MADDSNQYKLSSKDVWALGITVVIGGQYFGWNFGLVAGFGSFAIATVLIGSAYVCLINCLADITSGLPFAGGCYGLTRCMLGYYLGFILGFCEALEYITYVATAAVTVAHMIITLLSLEMYWQPISCFLFYLSAIGIYIFGGSWLWRVNMILAIISLFVLLIYVFGNISNVDIQKYGLFMSADDKANDSAHARWFIGGFFEFARVFPLAAWFYVGVESLGFSNDIAVDPTRNVPRGFQTAMATLFVTSILVLFVCSSSSPGVDEVSVEEFPLNFGFERIFHIRYDLSIAFSIPAAYATAFGFIFGYSKIFYAMAKSKLFPEVLTWTYGPHQAPAGSIIFGSSIGMCLCLIVYYYPIVNAYLFNMCCLSGFMTYIAQCLSYIRLKSRDDVKLGNLNPLGIYGAVYSIVIFSFGCISVIGFQGDDGIVVGTFFGIMLVLTVYYFAFVRKQQIFSEDEVKLMFHELIIKYNQRRLDMLRNYRTINHGNTMFTFLKSSKLQSIGFSFPKLSARNNRVADLSSLDDVISRHQVSEDPGSPDRTSRQSNPPSRMPSSKKQSSPIKSRIAQQHDVNMSLWIAKDACKAISEASGC